jgi:hypothetical protein
MSNQSYYEGPRNSTTAIISLILSILGLIGVLPFIGSIVGLILGYNARNEIERSSGSLSGRGMAQWGIILGWVGIALGVALACLLLTGVLAIPGLGICASLFGGGQY